MKILFDEHLPPPLAKGFAAFFAGEHEIVHLREKFGRGVKDIEWIAELNRDGRWIIISADRRITKNRVGYNAFRSSKSIGFFMAPAPHNSRMMKQAERLLAPWDGISEVSSRMEGGAMFELPMKSTGIRQMKF